MKENFTLNRPTKPTFFKCALITAILGFSLSTSAQMQDKINHPLEAIKGIEDVSKRDLFSRHYVGDDGTTALIGAGVINYKKDGSYYEINTAIATSSEVNYSYANTENLMETYFGATSHTGIRSKTP